MNLVGTSPVCAWFCARKCQAQSALILMPRGRNLDLAKIHASLNATCPQLRCQHPAGGTDARGLGAPAVPEVR